MEMFAPEFWQWSAIWSAIWTVFLVIPPGSTEIITSYRLNFAHGVISSVAAFACLYGYIDEKVAVTCTITYFVIDFINILLNDYVFKVPSYQNPQNRRVEYCHHILCFVVGITSQLAYKSQCTFTTDPYVNLMFAELSTPFLMAWRYTQNDILGGLFVLTFIGCRIVYHGLIFIPECMRSCKPTVGYGFGVPYILMNLYFLYMILRKFFVKKPSGKGDSSNKKSS